MRLNYTLLALAGPLAFIAGCGDNLEEVQRPNMECGEPCAAEFASVDTERPNRTQFILRSTGDADVRITSIRIENSSPFMGFDPETINALKNDGWFVDSTGTSFVLEGGGATSGAPLLIQPDRFQEITLVFGPTESDDQPRCPVSNANCGQVVVTTNAVNNPTITVPISLDVQSGDLVIDPNIVNYPEPIAGQTFEECWDLVNNGTSQVTVTATSTVPNLGAALQIRSADNLPLPISIEPAGRREFCGQWTPTGTESLNVSVQFQANDQDATNNVVLLRSGAGNQGQISVSPCDNIAFIDPQVGETSEIPIEITNTSAVNVDINSIALININPADADDDLGLVNTSGQNVIGSQQDPIGAGQSRIVNLQYTPTADRSITGVLRIGGNFAGVERRCTFAAGPAAPEIEVTPGRLFWSGLEPGDSASRSFVIYNRGRATLTISDVAINERGDVNENEFALNASADTPISIEPAGAYRVTVDYNRATDDFSADDVGDIVLTTNDPEVPTQTVFLTAIAGDTLLPPVCRITASPAEPYSVGDTVVLDASTSTAPDGGNFLPSPYTWTMVAPPGSVARLSSNAGASVNATFDVPGTYEVVLNATALIGTSEVTCESDPFNLLVVAN
jgi:hypothetical protein